MTTEQAALVERLKAAEAEHGDGLSIHRFCRVAGISDRRVYAAFPNGYPQLRAASGLAARRHVAKRYSDDDLLASFCGLYLDLNRVPKWREVDRACVASAVTYQKRFGTLRGVMAALLKASKASAERRAAGPSGDVPKQATPFGPANGARSWPDIDRKGPRIDAD